MHLQTPYLLFLGDAPDQLAAKVADGISRWRPENCVGQFRMEGCQADCGLEDISIEEAIKRGAKTLVIGVANRGGIISEAWLKVLIEAVTAGMDVAAGLHNKLNDIPELFEAAALHGKYLFDVRHPKEALPIGNGVKRTGKRLLPVGTDCSVGKMFTALAIEKEMLERDMKATFRATGQTGILISGDGISVDAVVADFIAGAIEKLSPDNDEDHWDIIEGQGSMFHPSYAGVTAGLIHGSQPDALVLCHEPTREHMRGVPDYQLPELKVCMDLNLMMAQRTNPEAKFVGIAINTSKLSDVDAAMLLADVEAELGLPTVDPVRNGVARIVDNL